jgi:hypothetical protein
MVKLMSEITQRRSLRTDSSGSSAAAAVSSRLSLEAVSSATCHLLPVSFHISYARDQIDHANPAESAFSGNRCLQKRQFIRSHNNGKRPAAADLS